jgi:peptidoglycan/LPS O-acetylase OafA/YrhL
MIRYRALDGLRGVAAVAVLLYHVGKWTNRQWLVPHAWIAVDFFFALSGFVIAHAYQDKLAGGAMRLMGFLRLRVIRLWPLILMAAVLAAVRMIWMAHVPPPKVFEGIWRDLLMVPKLTDRGPSGAPFGLNPPTWSLFFELAANLAWALAIPVLSRRVLIVVAAAAAVAMLASGQPLTPFGQSNFFMGFPRVVLPYALGVLCWRMRGSVRLAPPAWLLGALIVAICWIPAWTPALDVALIALVFPAIILLGARSRSDGRLLRFSGETSYPLYVLHWPVGRMLQQGLHLHGATAALVIVPGTLACAWLALKLFDEPVRGAVGAAYARAAARLAPAEQGGVRI